MSAATLLIDLGNTRMKWAWLSGDILGPVQAVGHAQADWLQQLAADLAGKRVGEIRVASVAAEPIEAALLGALLAARPHLAPRRLHTPAQAGGVSNSYAEPQRMGIDRFLALVGAHARHAGNLVLVSAGTALTIDVLAGNGAHQGGLILPGPDLMQEALIARSGRIQRLRDGRVDWLGRSTEDALASAAWLAAAALVERTFDQAALRLDDRPRLVLHGGQAEQLARQLDRQSTIEHDLVLWGMARFDAPVAS